MAALGRRNVQEQNRDTQARIRATSFSFRDDPLRYSWLIEVLQAKSLSPEQGVLVSVEREPEQFGDLCRGLWLTHEREFFEFSVLLHRDGAGLELEEWRDVTAQTTVNAREPGTGKSFGLLALEVLGEAQES
jgi:hypothetical protein